MTTDYGRDVWCFDSIKPGRYASGTTLVGQCVYHRLTTDRGDLVGGEDEGNFGLNLTMMLGQMTTPSSPKIWASRIRGEVLKDPRVEECEVSVVRSYDGPAECWTVEIKCYTGAGPFDLVIAVSDVTTTLVGFKS